MAKEHAIHSSNTANKSVRAVRLENFRDDAWQGPLGYRIFPRYPGARIMLRRPHVVVVELRTSSSWSQEDEDFFAEMWRQGYVQRWEPLAELPPPARQTTTIYEEIGYRIGSGERLTPTQQSALLSHLHDMEERALSAEKAAEEQRARADESDEIYERMATDWNELINTLNAELRVKVYHEGEHWIAENAETGQVLLRDVTLSVLYKKALRLRLEEHTHA